MYQKYKSFSFSVCTHVKSFGCREFGNFSREIVLTTKTFYREKNDNRHISGKKSESFTLPPDTIKSPKKSSNEYMIFSRSGWLIF